MPALLARRGIKSSQAAARLGQRSMINRPAKIPLLTRGRLLDAGRLLVLHDHRTPLIVARHDQQTELWAVGPAVPLVSSQRAGTDTDRSVADGRFRVLARRERNAVDNFMR